MRTEAEVERGGWPIPPATLQLAKEQGFSDESLEFLTGRERGSARAARQQAGIGPHIARIDTLAAEFPAETNYLYSTYHASGDEGVGGPATGRGRILVIGSGVYRIGSSVEFDWCCVNAVQAAAELGFETLMLNYNPETVSTDYDICDKLVFDEVSVESVLDLVEKERPDGVVVSMGGQIPNRLAMRLHHAGVPILGTSAEDIDRAEDRNKFSALLDRIGIDQPRWAHVTDVAEAERIVEALGGFPVLVRPSYVLSGAAMSVAHEHHELARILRKAKAISPEHPVVISKFEEDAREIEIDLVANQGELVLWAVSEHVEDAGVHSGDATLVLPPVDMTIPTLGQVRRIAQQIAKELRVTGPCNIQLLHRDGIVKVIECNLRASRSLPFVSKVTGRNYAKAATRIMLGADPGMEHRPLYELEHVGVKVPQFSFSRLGGADPLLGVEMASTGEVGCLGDSFHEALLHGLLATGFQRPKKGVLLSLGPPRWKHRFVRTARTMAEELGLKIYATSGTCRVLRENGIDATEVARVHSEQRPLGSGFDLPSPVSALDLIDRGDVDLVVNVPVAFDPEGRPDGYLVRRRAVDRGVPLITDPSLARHVVTALVNHGENTLRARAWNDFPGEVGNAGLQAGIHAAEGRETAYRQPRKSAGTWSAGLRPASRGSAKPAPTTQRPANVSSATSREPGRRSRSTESRFVPASSEPSNPGSTTPSHKSSRVSRADW
ncbi:CAD protein [Geodia barretti]|nr:CAD protein [Geodia barretti]